MRRVAAVCTISVFLCTQLPDSGPGTPWLPSEDGQLLGGIFLLADESPLSQRDAAAANLPSNLRQH
jgi:hypothetical protein